MQIKQHVFQFGNKQYEVYNFSKMHNDFKLINFQNFHIAVARYSGPIAAFLDKSIHSDWTISSEIEDQILFFTNKGKINKKVKFTANQKIILFDYIKQEQLLIMLNTGVYFIVDPFRGTIKQYKIDQSFKMDRISLSKIINSKIYFLSGKKIFEIKNLSQSIPKQKLSLPIKQDNPILFIDVLSDQQQRNIQVTYLHETNQIYYTKNQKNEKIFDCPFLNDKKNKLVYLNKHIYNNDYYYVLIFHNPFRVYFYQNSKFNYYEPDVKIHEDASPLKKSKTKSPWKQIIYHTAWINGIVFISNNFWTICVKLDGLQILKKQYGRISNEIDGIRIYGDSHNFLRQIPKYYGDLYNKNTQSGQLYKVYQSHLKGQVISKDILLKYAKKIEKYFQNIYKAAQFTLDPVQQMKILKFAIFIKTYYGVKQNLRQICEDFRIINALKYQCMNRFLTLKQFQYLKNQQMDRFITILLRYNLHYIADLIGGGQKVYVHWAKCKIQKEDKQVALNLITTKFQEYKLKYNKPISYIDIAKYAVDTGRFPLAQQLIEYQPNIQKRVTILLWVGMMKKDNAFIEKALQNAQLSRNSDIIFKLIKEIDRNNSFNQNMNKIIQQKQIIKKHYIQYLKLKNPVALKNYYLKKNPLQVSYMLLKQSLIQKNIDKQDLKKKQQLRQNALKYLPIVNDAVNNKNMTQYMKFLKKIRNLKIGEQQIDEDQIMKYKGENCEYLALLLLQKNKRQLCVNLLKSMKSDKAYDFLESIHQQKQMIKLAAQRKNLQKLRSLKQSLPVQFNSDLEQAIKRVLTKNDKKN